ncbi:non-ribosomal peptide synthetase [Nitrosomonas communis]|uniref:Non-ribosomal peptide synthase domain TIGR01720/amino acid adenylation domain-containing protein n=1 Tax=Nitrosomonas communis TaxID=44574 RepID=A0A1I4L2P8_9PROT|nr:non-ribosomal peptide synthetase [Nitrosomonas communis]SFL84947.1 non-ribosomal peptide synthase domain TIGR01720/amino acid adenylation domain-containing protein [Nitrosomonas communis]
MKTSTNNLNHGAQQQSDEDKLSINDNRYELSPLQEGMLIHSLADPGVGMYISQGVHSFEQIDVEAMIEAWQMIVDRHEVLRTSFVWENMDKPMQVVHSKVNVKFEMHDLRTHRDWEQKIKVRELLAADRNKGFNLSCAPLFRLHLAQRSERSYYLVFTHHHLLLDGWSIPILLNEVRSLYQAILRKHEISLPQPKPFRLYIQWLRKQKLDSEKKFWQEYLKGFKQPTPLPYDLGPHRQVGYPLKFQEWSLEVKDPLFTTLKTTARNCHVTLNTLIQAAWAILLSRYSEQENVVFGCLLSGRSSAMNGIEAMIGMFLNTLPMLVKVDPKAPLNKWLKYLHDQQNALQEHEFSPLNLVQRWSEIPPGTSLFESVIDTNNTHQPQAETDEALLTPINQSVPILLFAKPAAGRLICVLIYNDRRFTKPAIVQVGEQLITLLTSMCENSLQPVGELTMISDAEIKRITASWNDTQTFYPRNSTLHQLFEAQVASKPTALAVKFLDQSLSYEELNQKANQLAHYLYAMGISRGKLVGFCLDRSLDMVIVILAVLKSGAAYIPLDPNYPLDRLKRMLTDSKAELLLTQKKWLAELEGIAPRHLCVDIDFKNWAYEKNTNLFIDLSPEDIAYILYTSGSTGVPKGIMIPHRVTVNRMFIEFDPFEPDEALCAKTSICFVDSVWELWSAWANGLPVTLIPEAQIKDPSRLLDILSSSGATRIVLVPSLLRSMLDAEPDLRSKIPRLKHWICSGEALPADLSARFMQALPHAVLTNLYGATEVWDVTRCDTRDELPYETMPIGKTMGNMQTYILDEKMHPVPIGIIGELYIGGEHMAHGYWRRPDLTARQFVPNPFSREPGQRLYKTGDLGRWLPDGNIEYLGRRDHQIQLRGFRLELGDIESVIRQHPSISQAAVVVTDDQRLVAYIVSDRDPPPSSVELRKHVRLRLPEHMTPAFYLPLKDFPLTPNGKTDRRRLPKPKAESLKQIIEKEAISRPPESPTEKTVATVWANNLKLDKVGAESDFFQLGGDSLMAVRIITQIGKTLNISIPLSVLMETRTVADLAGWIDNAISNGLANPLTKLPDISKVDHKKAPLSYAQQQMWLLDQLNPGSISYTVPNILGFPFKVDIEALNMALAEILRRHETLRTTFAAIDGEPFQAIHEVHQVKIPIVDLTDLPIENRNQVAQKGIREQIRLPWNLATGPLFRYQLIKFAEDDHILAMTLHHIATDGHSMSILSNEIRVLYKAFQERQPSPLKELPIQYADYAIWQRDWLKGKQLEHQINFWKRKLSDTSVLELPTDHARPTVHRYKGNHFSIYLDETVLQKMRELASEGGATPFMVLLASFQLLLARYTGQNDVCVGTPTSNRAQPQLEKLIGYFVNTLVIRTKIEGNPSFRELLDIVRSECLEAYDHQEIPFEMLVDALGVQRNLSYNPLFQVLFVHQKLNHEEQVGTPTRHLAPTQETANFDLVLNAQESMDKLECKLIYNSDLFEPSTIERLGAHLELLMRQCVTDPDQSISHTSLLLPSERLQILQSFSQQKTLPFETRLAHQIIAANAHANPDKIAVQLDDNTLTYAELERRANQMAHHLKKLGVGSETVVGWCVERTPEIFIGLLAIMKAGGAFLSLDPAYPPERMEYMLRDTAASLVITQKKLLAHIPSDCCPLVLLDEDQDIISGYETTPPDNEVQPENLAYIIYTSGSTGLPKGVMIEHRNLANLISAQIQKFAITPENKVLQTLSLSFDAALGEIFRTLMAGATLYLAHKDNLMPGAPMIELLKNQHIDSVTLSAAALAALPKVSHELHELKKITVGGDTCAPELVMHWGKNRRFMNGYGPTETTIGATLAINWEPHKKPPLGKPLPNVEVYVLDRWMQPVPVGIPGELYIGGIGVGRGYLNRPEQTAASFIPHPFSTQPGARLYCTGDLGRWLPDGQLGFLGRADHQVKIRGYRIELTEIEAALSRHPNVNQAIVILHKKADIKRLAAYVTPKGDLRPTGSDLRAYLKKCLPDYMIPAFLTVCDSLPLTVTGKIDRNALPEPSKDELSQAQEYVEPKTVIEKFFAGIWANVLGLEKVSVNSNFFELGGDSIMSIRVVARITEAGYQLTLKEMFKYQTVAELAIALSADREIVAAEQGLVTGNIPLTPVQQWFFDLKLVNPHYFNQWMVIPTPPVLDCDKMRKAIEAVTAHHDALRIRFNQDDNGNWTQYNSDILEPIPFSIVNLSNNLDIECEQIIHTEFEHLQQSLNLEYGPLFQICWFSLGANHRGRLLIIAHHLVIDIVSWAILIEDLMTAYRQLNDSKEVHLPIKTSSFKQWAQALVEYAQSHNIKEEVPYWLSISKQTFQSLPVDNIDPDHSLATTQSVLAEVAPAKIQHLQNVVAPFFKTQFSNILLAALAISLSRFSSNTQIQIKVEGQGREDIGVELNLSRTLGWFTSFYPLSITVYPDLQLMEQVSAVVHQIETVPNRGIGYSALCYLNHDKELQTSINLIPESEIVFNFSGQSGARDSNSAPLSDKDIFPLGQLAETGKIQLAESDQGQRRHLIEIGAGILNGCLFVRFTYGGKRFKKSSIERLCHTLLSTLEEMIEFPVI